jgi:hypothetical protein
VQSECRWNVRSAEVNRSVGLQSSATGEYGGTVRASGAGLRLMTVAASPSPSFKAFALRSSTVERELMTLPTRKTNADLGTLK